MAVSNELANVAAWADAVSVTANTPQEQAAARRVVAEYATDPADEQRLLAALGLVGESRTGGLR